MPPPRLPEPRAVDPFEEAKRFFVEGLALLEAGRYEDAEQCFLSSLALQPGRISTLINLAATRLALSRPEDALVTADQILAAEADNIDAWFHRGTALGLLGRNEEALASFEAVLSADDQLVEAWFRRAEALQSLKRPEQALQSYDRALAIDPTLAQAWSNRGGILQEMRRLDDAAGSFRQAVAQGADHGLHSFYLAAVGDGPVPATAPQGYVLSLFDDYADQFDEHLIKVLHYRAHTVLAGRLQAMALGRFGSALDLGCGTGLCGPLVKPLCDRLTGVDLSASMLEKARRRGAYDQLVQEDITQFLSTTRESFDLVLAADVFIYVGDLERIFAAVAGRLGAQGVFCFSVEAAPAQVDAFALLPSLRYAHSEGYVLSLAKAHRFDVLEILRETIREDQGKRIEGFFVILRQGARAPVGPAPVALISGG